MRYAEYIKMENNKRNRKNLNWFITIPNYGEKEFMFNSLQEFSNRLVCSLEKHQSGQPHLHIFFNGIEAMNFDEIWGIIHEIIIISDEERTDAGNIQSVRNVRNVVLYVSKYDNESLWYGCKASDFRKSAAIKEWASTACKRPFSMLDDFVLENIHHTNHLEKIHKEAKRQFNKVSELSLIYGPFNEDIKQWQLDVIEWYNDWALNGWEHKKKQLWIWGPPNMYKTTFIEFIIYTGTQNHKHQQFCFSYNRSFPIGHYIEEYHLIGWNDEFKLDKVDTELWKQCVSGELVFQEKKGKEGDLISMRIPFIFTSNYAPDLTIPGVNERLKIITC